MRLGDKLKTTLLCSAVLGVLTLLLSHAIPEPVYAPAIAGVVAGLLLTLLVLRYAGGFSDIAVIGIIAALVGITISTLTYYTIIGLHLQAASHRTVLEYLVMMLRSGVLIVRFITDFVMGLATLLTSAGLVAVLVVGE